VGVPRTDSRHHAGLTVPGSSRPSNKEMKLTKPGQDGPSQLISSVRRTLGEVGG
jgi:hypothetical protein